VSNFQDVGIDDFGPIGNDAQTSGTSFTAGSTVFENDARDGELDNISVYNFGSTDAYLNIVFTGGLAKMSKQFLLKAGISMMIEYLPVKAIRNSANSNTVSLSVIGSKTVFKDPKAYAEILRRGRIFFRGVVTGTAAGAPASAYYLLTQTSGLLPNGQVVSAYPFVNADIAAAAAIANSKVAGLVNLGTNVFSAYPLALGTDVPHDTPVGIGLVVASAIETLLSTTGATNIVSYTPTAQGFFRVNIYGRVITASTTLTVVVTWADATGSQTYTYQSAVSLGVGSYAYLPLVLVAATSGTITVTVTAGTANQAYYSAVIEKLA
jgi:hypothetical protein